MNVLVLSGCAANGAITLGAVQRLYDLGYEFDAFVGASSGSIVGAGLAAGYTPVEMLKIVCASDAFKKLCVVNPSNLLGAFGASERDKRKKGVLDFEPVKQMLADAITARLGSVPTLSQLYDATGVEFACTTVDIDAKKTIILDRHGWPNLSLTDAVAMSSALPFIFGPVTYEGVSFVDGGIGDNFPIKYASRLRRTTGKKSVVGIRVADETSFTDASGLGKIAFFIRLFDALRVDSDVDTSDDVDVTRIDGSSFSSLNFNKSPKEIVDAFFYGYAAEPYETTTQGKLCT